MKDSKVASQTYTGSQKRRYQRENAMRYKTPVAMEQAVKAAARKSGRDLNKTIAAF